MAAGTEWREVEVEVGGAVHCVRTRPDSVRGMDALAVWFWGFNAWLPAGHVLGTDDDAEDLAVELGVRESAAHRMVRECLRSA